MLKELGIASKKKTIASKVFETLFSDFMEFKYESPSNYINYFWNIYEAYPHRDASLNGLMFEYILASLCIKRRVIASLQKC